tara:strand:+ start:1068 stop:1280 length:213 start_codon:yes stop_codon:yes gene_type:complete
MDGVFWVLGVIALIVGAISCLAGVNQVDFYQGAALLASGLGLLATAEIIKTLKEIRDRLPEGEKPQSKQV